MMTLLLSSVSMLPPRLCIGRAPTLIQERPVRACHCARIIRHRQKGRVLRHHGVAGGANVAAVQRQICRRLSLKPFMALLGGVDNWALPQLPFPPAAVALAMCRH